MVVTTWLDRITDESNLWLTAAKAEEAKDFPDAAVQYLSDASDCLERGSKVRAALSCYCAAECLAAMGAKPEARILYFQAGKLYSRIADHGVSGSIREALWALQRAHACYVHADRIKESEAIAEAFKLLARRANPFSGGAAWLDLPQVAPKVWGSGGAAEVPAEVKKALDGFLEQYGGPAARTDDAQTKPRRTGGTMDDQESFVSQLG